MRDLIVNIALKLGLYQQLMKINDYFVEKKSIRLFRKYGLQTLLQTDKAFRSMNAHMFLHFGTLLGAVRDHGFIPFDNDLDVGLLSTQRPDNIDDVMKQFGFQKKRHYFVKETGRITEEQYSYKGVQIDIFYFFEDDIVPDDNMCYCYVARRHETKEWKEANRTDGFPCVLWPVCKSPLQEINFLGNQFFIPEHAKEWLAQIYGSDYMTPIKHWSVGERKTSVIHHTERLYRKLYK